MAGRKKEKQKKDVVVDITSDMLSDETDGSQPPTPASENLGMDDIQRALDISVQPNFASITAAIKVILATLSDIAKSMNCCMTVSCKVLN
jgi:hypothetical protein